MKQLLIVILMLVIISCKSKNTAVVEKDSNVFYTCSMHPQIMESQPGNCPICGMKLIVVQKNNALKEGEIKLSDQQIQLGNIRIDTMRINLLGDQIALTATLYFDEMKTSTVSARVGGRIEHLYFKNMGDFIHKGDKLYDIYSEELNNAKQEYIMDVERQSALGNAVINFSQLLQSAKNKLQLWGMSDLQIQELAKNKKTSSNTTFYSTATGYVTALDSKEGDYIMEGATVVRLADLSTLWAEAQVYTSQLAQIDRNGIATVQIPDMPGKELKGTVEFVNPEINPDTRINLIRVSVPNQGNQLKPGMPAYVFIKSRKRDVISLPVDAVLQDANGATVWVETGKNTFKSRMVKTGLERDDVIEIKSGLQSGDVVVTSGVYLLNSEYIFKNGSSPMAGMKM
jgi:Cu(I)/Ag(I) efflux system membrane fusion protein